MLTTISPFPLYFDNNGRPLDGGSLHFGKPGANPETDPVTMYWDRAGTQPAAQPVRVKNGYPVRNGTPAELFSPDPFSLNVRNAAGQLMFYQPRGATSGSLYFNVIDFGAVGDGVTDDTAAIQAAINAANPRGGVVYFPRGDYLISSGLTVDNSLAVTGPQPDDYFARKASMMGDGMASSRILGAAGNYTMLTMIGGNVNAVISQQFLRGLTFEKADKTGKVVSFDNMAYFSIENCYFSGGDEVANISDCVVVKFESSFFMFGNKGMRAFYSNAAHPNALTFSSCVWAGNTTYGAQFVEPTTLNIYGGTFEGNGRDALATYNTAYFGLKVTDSGPGGAAGLVMSGVYFEHNGGIADVYIEANGTGAAAHSISGCTFNRIDSAAHTKHSLYATSSASAAINNITLIGCGHKSFNSYAPDVSRKYLQTAVSGGGVVNVGWTGALFEDAPEVPSIPNAITGSGGIVDEAADYDWTGTHVFDAGATGDPAILAVTAPATRIVRTSPSGGLGQVRAAFIIDHKVSASTTAFEWSLIARNSNYSTGASANDCVGIYGQAYKYEVGGRSWAGVFEAKDFSGNSGAGILCGVEVDVFANGSAGAGSRLGFEVVFGKADPALTAPTIGTGIRLAPQGGVTSNASLQKGLEFQIGCSNSFIDINNNASGTYFLDALYSGGFSKFMRFYSSSMPAFVLASSGGSLGSYVGRLNIDIDGYTYWLPVYG